MRSSYVLAPHKYCKTCENLLLTLPDRLCTPASRMASEFWGQIPSAFAVSNVGISGGLKSLHPIDARFDGAIQTGLLTRRSDRFAVTIYGNCDNRESLRFQLSAWPSRGLFVACCDPPRCGKKKVYQSDACSNSRVFRRYNNSVYTVKASYPSPARVPNY